MPADIVLIIVLIPLFAVINRIRGGDTVVEPYIRKTTGVLLGVMMVYFAGRWVVRWPPDWSWVFALLPAVGYVVGEDWGWGKWIGGIIHHGEEPDYVRRQGYRSGIHPIANALIDEHKHYLAYCRLALMLRGIWWWVPVLVPFYIFGCFGDWGRGGIKLAIAIVAFGLAFPLSVELSRQWNLRRPEFNGSLTWAQAEIVYGALHGGFLGLLVVL